MRFAIFTHVPHFKVNSLFYAYAPYTREMNIWLEFVDEVEILAPLSKEKRTTEKAYKHKQLKFSAVNSFNFVTFSAAIVSLFKIPFIFFKIISVMRTADHLHIRCPGNIGLLACIAQIFFPNKQKTAKYAGNWDPHSLQPWTYRLQRRILNNSLLTKNMKVLVYGKWPNSGTNILPFFTASFSHNDKENVVKNFEPPYKFIFVGNLVSGKRPLFCLKIMQKLLKINCNVELDIYGEGPLRKEIEKYIETYNLCEKVNYKGNKSIEVLKSVYQNSHFCLLPSKSEGWPKALAEAMFYGCIPIALPVSCIPWMLDYGNRGILIEDSLEATLTKIVNCIESPEIFFQMSKEAQKWSQEYTLEKFRKEIKQLL